MNEGRMGVALGGALDDHKEAVEGSVRLAKEAAAVVASREGGKEGGHEHGERVHGHGKEGETAAVDNGHKNEEEEHRHDHSHSHSHDEHKHKKEGEEKDEEETQILNNDHSHSHGDHSHSSHSHDHGHTHSHDGHHHDHDHDHDHSSPGKTASQTTAETRFRIGTFIYLQRKPFHPDRFADFLEELAASSYAAVENVVGAKVKTESGKGFGTSSSSPSSSSSPLVTSVLSGLLRSKGFLWLACTDQAALYFSHAGRSLSVSCMGRWWASVPKDSWPEGREKDIWEDFGGEGEGGREGGFGDRRNELVFIGVGLFEGERQRALKERLDACLLTGEEGEGREGGWGGEMALYVDKAKEGSALALFDAFPNRIEIDMAGAPGQ